MKEKTERELAQSYIAENRKAYHDFHLLETFEAGVALLGTEVKAIREGRVNLRDSYAEIRGGEVFVDAPKKQAKAETDLAQAVLVDGQPATVNTGPEPVTPPRAKGPKK